MGSEQGARVLFLCKLHCTAAVSAMQAAGLDVKKLSRGTAHESKGLDELESAWFKRVDKADDAIGGGQRGGDEYAALRGTGEDTLRPLARTGESAEAAQHRGFANGLGPALGHTPGQVLSPSEVLEDPLVGMTSLELVAQWEVKLDGVRASAASHTGIKGKEPLISIGRQRYHVSVEIVQVSSYSIAWRRAGLLGQVPELCTLALFPPSFADAAWDARRFASLGIPPVLPGALSTEKEDEATLRALQPNVARVAAPGESAGLIRAGPAVSAAGSDTGWGEAWGVRAGSPSEGDAWVLDRYEMPSPTTLGRWLVKSFAGESGTRAST